MKVTVSRTHCLDALKAVAKLIGGKPAVGDKPGGTPAPRKQVRLDACNEGLRIFGGEKEGFASVFLPARKGEYFESGSILAPPWRLLQILEAGRGEDVKLYAKDKDRCVSVVMRDASFQIAIEDPDLFPLQTPSELPLIVSSYFAPLRLALQRTVFIAENQDDPEPGTQPGAVYNVVCFDVGQELWLCATNGQNLSMARVNDAKRATEGRVADIQIPVPRDCAADLLTLIGDEMRQLEVRADDRLVCFAFESRGLTIKFYSVLIQRRLPRYRKIIPALEGRSLFTLQSRQLASAATLMKPFTTETGIGILVKDNVWHFMAQKSGVGDAHIDIDAVSNSTNHTHLRLPATKLARFAEVAGADAIQALTGGEGDPVLFRVGDGFMFVMMQLSAVAAVETPKTKPANATAKATA